VFEVWGLKFEVIVFKFNLFYIKHQTFNIEQIKRLSSWTASLSRIVKKVKLWYDVERNMVF